MPGISGFKNKIKRLSKANLAPLVGSPVSIVFMDEDGEILWEEGVNYNTGVLAVPLPCSIDEWEERNILEDRKKKKLSTNKLCKPETSSRA